MGSVPHRVPMALQCCQALEHWLRADPQLPTVILSGFAMLRGWHCSLGAAQSPAVWAGASAGARAAPSFSVLLCKPKIPGSVPVG